MRNVAPKQKDNKRISKTVQRSIPIHCIHRDGIWEVGGKYSRTWRFLDINFSVADEDDKRNMLIDYCSLEKALPTDAITKISIVNKKLNPKSFEEEILLPLRGNALDSYRKEYNRVLADKAAEGNNIVQERYITVSVQRKSMEEARNFFVRIASDLSTNLKKLGSKLIELNNEERLALLHDFFRIGEEGLFSFDFDTLSRRGEDFKDSICPDSIQFHSNYFELSDNKVGRVLFLKGYPTYMPDSFLKSLTDVNRNMVISIDIQPVPTDVAIKRIQNKELSLDTDITRWQNKQNQNNNFSAVPPSNLTARRNDIREMLEDINTRDQRISLCVLTLVHIADTGKCQDSCQ